jgi:hypothetical protein
LDKPAATADWSSKDTSDMVEEEESQKGEGKIMTANGME